MCYEGLCSDGDPARASAEHSGRAPQLCTTNWQLFPICCIPSKCVFCRDEKQRGLRGAVSRASHGLPLLVLPAQKAIPGISSITLARFQLQSAGFPVSPLGRL